MKYSRRTFLGGVVGAAAISSAQRAVAQLWPWWNITVAPPPSFAVDAADIRYSGTWRMPAMSDGSKGTLKMSIYLDSTNGDNGGVPDLYQVYPDKFGSLLDGPQQIPIFIGNGRLVRSAGMWVLAVESISNAVQAVVTLYGPNPLNQFSTLGTKIYVNVSTVYNPGWSGGLHLCDVISFGVNSVVVGLDTSGFPAYVPSSNVSDSTSEVFIGVVTGVTSEANAVFSFSIPHGIDTSGGPIYISLAFTSPAPIGGSGWDTVHTNTKIKVLSSDSLTLTTDLNSTGFSAWNTVGQYGVVIDVLNTFSVEIENVNWNNVQNPMTEPAYTFANQYLYPLKWNTWLEVMIAWDTNHAVGTKLMSVVVGEKVLTSAFSADQGPAFNLPYRGTTPISLTWSSSVATATGTQPHGYSSGEYTFVVENATSVGYDGTFLCTITGVSSFTYALGSNPGGSATADFYRSPQGLENTPPAGPSEWALFYLTDCYAAEIWFDATTYLDASDAANRRLFWGLDGKPISLGADGSLPTGSPPTFYLSIGPSTQSNLVPPVGLQFVDPNSCELGQESATLGGISDSTQMVLSFWVDRNLQWFIGSGICVGIGSIVSCDNTQNPVVFTVTLRDDLSNQFEFSFTADLGSGANVRMSVDTAHAIGEKIVHVFVGLTEVAVTVIEDDVDDLDVNWQDGSATFDVLSFIGGYIGDLWFGPGQLFDVTNKFVDGSGGPVNLGPSGQLPSGTPPAVYLHCDSGDPATAFQTNRGSGGVVSLLYGSGLLLQQATRISDNLAGNGQMQMSLESSATGYGTVLLAPTSPTT